MAQGRPGRKREREFLTTLKRSFLERGAFFYKIPDMPHFEGAKFRFDIPKPFDAIGHFAGQAFAIEAKVITRFKNFTLKDLRPSQIDGLGNWAKAGGKAYVFILLWQQGQSKHCSTPMNRLMIVPWEKLKADGRVTKVEMVCLPAYPRQRVKHKDNSATHFYNVDNFLISLVMND